MIKKAFSLTIFVAIFLALAACAGPSRLEMDYGTSYKLVKFNQILNPDAEKNLEPVTGLNGRAAQATIEKYQKDFERPTPMPVYSINIGSLGTGASR